MIALVLAASLLTADPQNALTVEASLPAELTVGESHEMEVRWSVKEGWSATDSGIPKPILQIQVPDCVRLEGEYLETLEELSRNEFLQSPFERLLEESTEGVPFQLRSAPGDADVIAFTVMAYVTNDPEVDGWFLRQRFEIPVKPGAQAAPVDAGDSMWGRGDTLQIGDEAVSFELPRADGSLFLLDEFLYDKNVIVTTYRAFW